MAATRQDEQWVRHRLALLEMSTGVLGATPVPARRVVRRFAEVARGLAKRAPDWLAAWPVLEVRTGGRPAAGGRLTPFHSVPSGLRPRARSFFRSVLRLIPSSAAARSWLPPVSRRTAMRSGRSTRPRTSS